MKLCIFKADACIICRSKKYNERQVCLGRSPGLGDIVAAGLSSVGITKQRVSAIVGGDCGCEKRQEWLNHIGQKLGIGRPLDQPPPAAD